MEKCAITRCKEEGTEPLTIKINSQGKTKPFLYYCLDHSPKRLQKIRGLRIPQPRNSKKMNPFKSIKILCHVCNQYYAKYKTKVNGQLRWVCTECKEKYQQK